MSPRRRSTLESSLLPVWSGSGSGSGFGLRSVRSAGNAAAVGETCCQRICPPMPDGRPAPCVTSHQTPDHVWPLSRRPHRQSPKRFGAKSRSERGGTSRVSGWTPSTCRSEGGLSVGDFWKAARAEKARRWPLADPLRSSFWDLRAESPPAAWHRFPFAAGGTALRNGSSLAAAESLSVCRGGARLAPHPDVGPCRHLPRCRLTARRSHRRRSHRAEAGRGKRRERRRPRERTSRHALTLGG